MQVSVNVEPAVKGSDLGSAASYSCPGKRMVYTTMNKGVIC